MDIVNEAMALLRKVEKHLERIADNTDGIIAGPIDGAAKACDYCGNRSKSKS